MISRQLLKSRGKPNCNNGLGFRNGVKCLPCFTIYHHFLCMSVLLCGGRFSNFALSRNKNPGCVAAFCAMRHQLPKLLWCSNDILVSLGTSCMQLIVLLNLKQRKKTFLQFKTTGIY